MPKNLFNKLYSPVHARSILRVGWPLIVNNLALMGINLTDTIMAGRYSTEALAAIAAGGSVWSLIFIGGMGLLMALSPITAQLVGAKKSGEVGHYVRQGFWLALLVAIPMVWFGQNAEAVFVLFGLESEIVELSDDYLSAITLGIPFAYMYLVMRMCSEGIAHTRPIMYISIFGMCTNVFFNWVLMYGNLGFPAMGAKGCGYASALNLIVMSIILLVYVNKHYRYKPLKIFKQFEWPQLSESVEILRLGLPIAGSLVAEIGLFACAALLMGGLGTNTIAAHQIAINYAAFMFMIPFGASMASTSVVGNLLGRQRFAEARAAGHTGMVISVGFMTISALVMILFANQIIGLYTTDTEVAVIAVSLLGVAAAFQIVDGLQVAAGGALRGYKDTEVPMYINIFSYWAIGFVLAWGLGVYLQKGPVFVWLGLVAGLFVASVLLTWRFERLSCSKLETSDDTFVR